MSAVLMEDGNEVNIPEMVPVAFLVPLDLLKWTIEVRHVYGVVLWFLLLQEVPLFQGDFMIFQGECPEFRDVVRVPHPRSRSTISLTAAVTIVECPSSCPRSTGSDEIVASLPESSFLHVTLPGANSFIFKSRLHLASVLLPNLISTPLHVEEL